MYLVDTNVISAQVRAEDNRALLKWMDRQSQRLYLSTITVAEIEAGIAKLRREGATQRTTALTEWLETVLHLYADRILPFDIAIARIAGVLTDMARAKGQPVGFPDAAIAATAKAHALTVLTRNTKHFAVFDVPIHDPFKSPPS